MPKFSLTLIFMLSLSTTAFGQTHTSPGGGDPDAELDRGEGCRHLLRSSEKLERAFVENQHEWYKKEDDFFNLLSRVTLKNDLKILEKGKLNLSVNECHLKVKSDLEEIKSIYTEAIRPDQSCPGFSKRKDHVQLIDDVIKLYDK